MAIRTVGGMRALAAGLLVLVLVVTGAMPAAAGGSGPAGSGPRGKPAGAQSGGGHKSTVSSKQVNAASGPSARKSQGSSPRPARHTAAGPRMAKASAAPAKPSAPNKPSAPAKPAPAEHRPDQKNQAPEPDREPDQAKHRREESTSSADRPRAAVRSSTVATARRPVSRVDRLRPVRAVDRSVAAVVASAADPSTALFEPPPVVKIQAAAVELEPRQLWPRLPGPAGHPAFPGLLAAVLLGFIALGFRGDRRDPKLAAAAIDDRDDRAEFR